MLDNTEIRNPGFPSGERRDVSSPIGHPRTIHRLTRPRTPICIQLPLLPGRLPRAAGHSPLVLLQGNGMFPDRRSALHRPLGVLIRLLRFGRDTTAARINRSFAKTEVDAGVSLSVKVRVPCSHVSNIPTFVSMGYMV
jgi:hypothetical protein